MIKLKEIRTARGITQGELARMVRQADPTADQVMISVLERGELYPSEKLRDALCEALGCSESELYDGVEAFFVPSDEKEFSYSTKILSNIFNGFEGKINRKELRMMMVEATNAWVTDRSLRKMIEKARQEGMLIANDQDGNGYYVPQTRAEIEAQYKRNQNRALAILRQQKFLRRRLND